MSFKEMLPVEFTKDLASEPGDRAELIFQSLVDLGAFNKEQSKSRDFRAQAVRVLKLEIDDLNARAAAAGIEIETFVNLNKDIISLLAAYDGTAKSYPEYYQGESYRSSATWTPQTDLEIPSAGGVRGMRVGEEADLSGFEKDESGLYLCGSSRDEQRKRGAATSQRFNDRNVQGLVQTFLDPSSYVAINAIRRIEGKTLLDRLTFTRFVGMKDVSALTPNAGLNDQQVAFDSSRGFEDLRSGVRFAVEKI